MKGKCVVHIGLPKTGTTSLQKYVLPEICKIRDVKLNPAAFREIAAHYFEYTSQMRDKLRLEIERESVLISNEGLVDWNPRNCLCSADRLLDLFGSKAQIVISVREPVEYLTSMYVQRIQLNNHISPEDFFVSSGDYDRLSDFLPKNSLLRFDYESFDLDYMYKVYKERFEKVFILPSTRISSLFPFCEIFELSPEEVKVLQHSLFRKKPQNRSYSAFAVKLSFAREFALNILGAKSISSEGGRKIDRVQRAFGRQSRPRYVESRMRQMKKLWRICGGGSLFSFRWWMQCVVDRFFPYQRYKLPSDVVEKINSDLMERNKQFVERAELTVDENLLNRFPNRLAKEA